MRFFRFLSMVVAISLWVTVGTTPIYASLTEMDTSVVRLDINNRKFSEEFELYDDGETVLLPLLGIGDVLDAEVALDPVLMTATVVRPWDGQQGLIDLKRQVLFWGEEQIAMSPHAMLGPGDFFVPLHVVEHLMDVQTVWKPEAQILAITVERSLSKLRLAVDPNQTARVPGSEDQVTLVPTHAPPMVSLGAIQYVLTHGLSNRADEVSDGSLALSAHWQAAGIPVDIAIKGTGITSSDPLWELKRITATYLSPRLEVVAGDSTFSLGRTLRNIDIRGLRSAAPPGWASGILHAVTSVEGWTSPGAEVELRVNGAYLGKQLTTDGRYVFPQVPLQITRANRVEVTVIDANGNRTVETRIITATPRLLTAGKVQVAAGGGWVKSDKTGAWDSAVMGASAYTGITSWLTVSGEIARQVMIQEGDDSPARLAGTVGLALRTGDNLVFALDWLASKLEHADGPPAQGAELTANLQLGKVGWQSIVFYRQPGLQLFSPIQSDTQGFKVVAEYNISRAWSLQASYEATTPVTNPQKLPVVKIEGVAQWTPSGASSVVLRLQHIERDKDSAILTHRYTNPKTGTDLKWESKAEWVEHPEVGSVLANASAKAELDQALNDTSYLGVRYHATASWPTSSVGIPGSTLLKNTVKVDGTWMPGSFHLSAMVQGTDVRSTPGGTTPFSEGTVLLNVSKMSGVLITGAAAQVMQTRWNDDMSGAITGSIYLGAKTNPGLSGLLKLDYTHPIWGETFKESMKTTLRGDLRLTNGFYLGVMGQVAFKTAPTWHDPEYYVGITLSQGLGFSNGGIRGFQAVNGRPLGYIEGTVYIDSNRNGKRDADEKVVAGAPVALAGRRAITDQHGKYCFEFVNPGTYRLGLDPNKLSADFTIFTDPVVVRLPANANLSQDFAVILNGTVDGTVFIDLNGDGLVQPGEPRPAWVKVLLDGKTEAFTDNRGNYSFGNLSLGKHTLSVSEANLPTGTLAPAPVEIEISEKNLDIWDIMLPLQLAGQKN